MYLSLGKANLLIIPLKGRWENTQLRLGKGGGAPHPLGAKKSLVLSHVTSEGRLEKGSDWHKLTPQVGGSG